MLSISQNEFVAVMINPNPEPDQTDRHLNNDS